MNFNAFRDSVTEIQDEINFIKITKGHDLDKNSYYFLYKSMDGLEYLLLRLEQYTRNVDIHIGDISFLKDIEGWIDKIKNSEAFKKS